MCLVYKPSSFNDSTSLTNLKACYTPVRCGAEQASSPCQVCWAKDSEVVWCLRALDSLYSFIVNKWNTVVNSRVPWGEKESALRVISDPLLWCAEAPLLLPADNEACVCVCVCVTGGALSPHNAQRPRKASLLIFLCEFLSYLLALEPLSTTFTFSLVPMKGKLILLRWFWKETEIAIFHQYKVVFCVFFQGRKGDPGISPGPAPKGEKVLSASVSSYTLNLKCTNIKIVFPFTWTIFLRVTSHCPLSAFKHSCFVFQGDSGIIGPVGLTGQTGRKVRPSNQM